jgi:UDP-N-acetylmuramoyl-L-alanyl-D-glutamate--2,6-diaminopimelate ligase
MRLTDLLAECVVLTARDLTAIQNINITGITLDSRVVKTDHLFIALAGSKQHGLSYAKLAIAQGASAILFDPAGNGEHLVQALQQHSSVPMLAVTNLGSVLGTLAAKFYGDPSQSMTVLGITGTNGKTSCSQFLAQMLNDCGIIGTLGWGEWGKLNHTLNTTPDALAIQHIFAELLKSGKHSVAMEVSSHGLEQGRVNGVHFAGAVFTNISRDHLDYHGTMEAYLDAKLQLLQVPDLKFVVINLNDSYSKQTLAAVPNTVKVWGVSHNHRPAISANTDETIHATNLVNTLNGIHCTVQWRDQSAALDIPLYGDFNVENVLCVLAVLLALGQPLNAAVNKLATLKAVAGRMERFGGHDKPLVFVDYAHTPDALEKVLESARKHCHQTLWLVFGCGGNRDKGKRAEMGECAVRLADKVIITDDNPRFEQSADIIEDIVSGCDDSYKISVISDRELAIRAAIHQAVAGDCVIIAGKGHEDYQEINGVKQPFSDSICVLNALRG